MLKKGLRGEALFWFGETVAVVMEKIEGFFIGRLHSYSAMQPSNFLLRLRCDHGFHLCLDSRHAFFDRGFIIPNWTDGLVEGTIPFWVAI